MNLVLEVVGHNAQGLAAERRKVFGVGGGSIGRAPECDWVLSSPYVSRHHATVCCINGVFYIESTGENGVAVNAPQSVLPQLERRALKTGDRVFIDEYEISVGISGAQSRGAEESTDDSELDVFGKGEVRNPFGVPDSSDSIDELDEIGDGNLDPLKGLAGRASGSAVTTPRHEPAWNHSSSLADHFTPPPVAPSTMQIDEDWNQTEFTATPKRPVTSYSADVTAPRVQNVVPPPSNVTLAPPPPAVPAAAPVVAPPPVPPVVNLSSDDNAAMNAIVRNIVQGLIEVLRARSEFRNQFRLPLTRVRTTENNPLKFAINADDALDSLMNRRNPGFMPAAEAFDDAFNDIRFHQLAMIAGMRAGFECVMSRFDPEKLQERFDRQLKGGGFLSVASKLRYWDLYSDWFEELSGNADSAFQRLFGEEFANAYEQQLETLKRSRGNPRH